MLWIGAGCSGTDSMLGTADEEEEEKGTEGRVGGREEEKTGDVEGSDIGMEGVVIVFCWTVPGSLEYASEKLRMGSGTGTVKTVGVCGT
jgi:hypothetical protein